MRTFASHGLTAIDFRNAYELQGMPVNKCIADTNLLAEILLQKYEYLVPLYQQIQPYRHLGMKGLHIGSTKQ